MSMNDSDITNQKTPSSAVSAPAEDDFVFSATISQRQTATAQHERRLHLRAFDYWHALNADREFPLFADLTPEGLSPFKDNCLLLAFTEAGASVRFCGARVKMVLGGNVEMGTLLHSIKGNEFAAALADRFVSYEGRTQAAEFEFIERSIESRGIMLPFSAHGDGAQFVMVVVNHRERLPEKAGDKPAGKELAQALAAAASTCAEVGAAVVHPDNTSRQGLYAALAQTFAFHIAASRDPVSYRRYLRTEGLRQQKRAPFTPALKLTFGKDYDKTRITEYAAALSFAARNEITPDGLVNFLNNVPGGIKGCVQNERSLKKGGSLGRSVEPVEQLMARLKTHPAVALNQINLRNDYSLVLVRRKEDGTAEVVAPVSSSEHQIVRAAREILSKRDEP
ncbi:PAS domain-containing protein [Kordiimonas aquimaris]|uniref:hypothetical protein n=1 Tax=Kordiimonas aquimaris TaxID=707591 RepID=UPI0021CE7358|nr:hypothetical protein [Kordiimonas aquimaris]